MAVAVSSPEIFTGFAPPDPAMLAKDRGVIEKDLGSRYTVNRFIARGGFASVWQAFDRVEGVSVAVKRIDPQVGRGRDFFRELRAMFVLQHPNIVRIVNFQETAGIRYLILELCHGGTLRGMISRVRKRNQSWPSDRVVALVCQLAQGLVAAHRLGFTHRDLKPENVLFADDSDDLFGGTGPVKLADFGLATLLSGADESAQLRGLTGSPAYMAPEQFTSCFSPASDIYALGVIAYELLMGDLPFHGSPEELARQHLYEHPRIPSSLPEPWALLLPKLLAKSPLDRPTAQDVVDRLSASARSVTATKPNNPPPATIVDRLPTTESPSPRTLIIRLIDARPHLYTVHAKGLEPWTSQEFPPGSASIRYHDLTSVHPEPDGSVWFVANRRISRFNHLDQNIWHARLPEAIESPYPFLYLSSPRAVGWIDDQLACIDLSNGKIIWRKTIANAGMKRYFSYSAWHNHQFAVTDLDGGPGLRILSADGEDVERIRLPGMVWQLGEWPGSGGWFLRILGGNGFEAALASPSTGCHRLPGSTGIALLAQCYEPGPLIGVWPNGDMARWDSPDHCSQVFATLPSAHIRGLAACRETVAALLEDSDSRTIVWSGLCPADMIQAR